MSDIFYILCVYIYIVFMHISVLDNVTRWLNVFINVSPKTHGWRCVYICVNPDTYIFIVTQYIWYLCISISKLYTVQIYIWIFFYVHAHIYSDLCILILFQCISMHICFLFHLYMYIYVFICIFTYPYAHISNSIIYNTHLGMSPTFIHTHICGYVINSC